MYFLSLGIQKVIVWVTCIHGGCVGVGNGVRRVANSHELAWHLVCVDPSRPLLPPPHPPAHDETQSNHMELCRIGVLLNDWELAPCIALDTNQMFVV